MTKNFKIKDQNPQTIWYSKPKPISEINQKREKKIYSSILSEPKSSIGQLEFYKFLASFCETNEIFLSIPETIIIGYGFKSPVLLYNDDKGIIRIQRNLGSMQFKLLIELFEALRQNNSQSIAPIAIKKEIESYHNRIIMKPSELAFEWKYAYNVDVILQRFICNKGCKASKISVKSGKDLKAYKIINKKRSDQNSSQMESPKKTRFSFIKHSQKNSLQIFFKNFLIQENGHKFRLSIKPEQQDLSFKNQNSPQKTENLLNTLQVPKFEQYIASNKNSDRLLPNRKSLIVTPDLNVPVKKTIFTLNDYLKTCIKKVAHRPVQEIIYDLKYCKSQDCELEFEGDEAFYVNNFKENIRALYSVSSKIFDSIEIYEIRSESKINKLGSMVNTIRKILNSQSCTQGKLVSALSCDFIEDSEKNIFFIGIKQYETIKVKPAVTKLAFEFKFSCPGVYCKGKSREKTFKPSHTMLKKKLGSIKNQEIYLQNYLERVKVCKECYEGYALPSSVKPASSMAGLRLKTFEKSEISSLLDEINPSNANETCKMMYKKSDSHQATPSTALSEHQFPKQISSQKLITRQNYFKNKIKEIQIASNEESFLLNNAGALNNK